MAKREVLGKMECPECGFPDAEIKPQKTDRLFYRWCPDCNAQYFARTAEASERLLAKVGAQQEKKIPREAEQKTAEPEPAENPASGKAKPHEMKAPPKIKPGMAGALELLGVR